MEWLEKGLRQALHLDGAALLEELLNEPGLALEGNRCAPGEKRHPDRSKEVQTLLGKVRLRRDYFHDAVRQTGRHPLDEALGLVHSASPGLVRVVCRMSARSGYAMVSEDLKAVAGIELSERLPQRLVNLVGPEAQEYFDRDTPCAPPNQAIPLLYVEADGTGVPMRPCELKGRVGKQPDGTSRTREVKLGCVFTQHITDEKGRPIRDPSSTSYVGSFQSAADFGGRLRQEASRRGSAHARQIVFLGDGALWIWEMARVNFPAALQILDCYHALEHLHELTEELWPQSEQADRQFERWKQWLAQDRVGDVIEAAQRRLRQRGDTPQSPADKKIAYFRNNRHRMAYGTYRQAGCFIGSGVVEAGCKTVVGKRLKESGMFWTETGAQNVLTFRCALLSGRFDDFWDARNAPLAA